LTCPRNGPDDQQRTSRGPIPRGKFAVRGQRPRRTFLHSTDTEEVDVAVIRIGVRDEFRVLRFRFQVQIQPRDAPTRLEAVLASKSGSKISSRSGLSQHPAELPTLAAQLGAGRPSPQAASATWKNPARKISAALSSLKSRHVWSPAICSSSRSILFALRSRS